MALVTVVRRLASVSAQGVADPAEGPEEALAGKQIEHALTQALSALEPTYREVLVLRDIEGLTAPEVAEVLGATVTPVGSGVGQGRPAGFPGRKGLNPFAIRRLSRGMEATMKPVQVTEQNFAETVKQGIVLLDFWAAWCGPCRAFAPVFDAAAARHPEVAFGKVDTEAEPGLAAAFGIRSIPTLMVLRDGVLLASQPGALPGKALDEIIRKVQELDMDEVRRSIDEQEREPPRSASAGGV